MVTKGASSQGIQEFFHTNPPGFTNTAGWAGAHGARGTSLGRLAPPLPLSTSQLRSHSHPQVLLQHISALLLHPALFQCHSTQSCSAAPGAELGTKGHGSGTPPQHLSWQGLRGDSLASGNISGCASTAQKPGELQGRASPRDYTTGNVTQNLTATIDNTDTAQTTQLCHYFQSV